MPRKLPWATREGAVVASSPKRLATAPKPATKRPKLSDPASGSDTEGNSSPNSDRQVPEVQAHPPSSPPPEQPSERFMIEGLEHDDKYRIVEDELLTLAQRFTVHLHAAEYKRQEKAAKARNAETISSISRPVTGKVTNRTKRKIQAIAQSKMQQNALQSLVNDTPDPVQEPDESSDDEEPAYFGTTLHGLMDSPRQKSTALTRVSSGAATRAAAGFQKPTGQLKSEPSFAPESPLQKLRSVPRFPQPIKVEQESSTESSDLDDDLDAPISTPKPALETKTTAIRKTGPSSPPLHTARVPKPINKSKPQLEKPPPFAAEKGSPESSSVAAESTQASSDSRSRVRRRLELARVQKDKQEKEDQGKKKLDLIPTFL